MFDAITTSGTGLQTFHTWLDSIANNIANMNDTTPTTGKAFEAQYVQASEITGGADGIGRGVEPVSVTRAKGNGIMTYEPDNPIADKQGYVRRADVDLSAQMGDMIAAQRGFQANASVISQARDAYEAAIGIGKGI